MRATSTLMSMTLCIFLKLSGISSIFLGRRYLLNPIEDRPLPDIGGEDLAVYVLIILKYINNDKFIILSDMIKNNKKILHRPSKHSPITFLYQLTIIYSFFSILHFSDNCRNIIVWFVNGKIVNLLNTSAPFHQT